MWRSNSHTLCVQNSSSLPVLMFLMHLLSFCSRFSPGTLVSIRVIFSCQTRKKTFVRFWLVPLFVQQVSCLWLPTTFLANTRVRHEEHERTSLHFLLHPNFQSRKVNLCVSWEKGKIIDASYVQHETSPASKRNVTQIETFVLRSRRPHHTILPQSNVLRALACTWLITESLFNAQVELFFCDKQEKRRRKCLHSCKPSIGLLFLKEKT